MSEAEKKARDAVVRAAKNLRRSPKHCPRCGKQGFCIETRQADTYVRRRYNFEEYAEHHMPALQDRIRENTDYVWGWTEWRDVPTFIEQGDG